MASFNFNFDGEDSKLTYNEQNAKFDDMSIYAFKHNDGTMHVCLSYTVKNDDGSTTSKNLIDCEYCNYHCFCGVVESDKTNLAEAAKIIAQKFDYKKKL